MKALSNSGYKLGLLNSPVDINCAARAAHSNNLLIILPSFLTGDICECENAPF
jgi:hypothetical protein